MWSRWARARDPGRGVTRTANAGGGGCTRLALRRRRRRGGRRERQPSCSSSSLSRSPLPVYSVNVPVYRLFGRRSCRVGFERPRCNVRRPRPRSGGVDVFNVSKLHEDYVRHDKVSPGPLSRRRARCCLRPTRCITIGREQIQNFLPGRCDSESAPSDARRPPHNPHPQIRQADGACRTTTAMRALRQTSAPRVRYRNSRSIQQGTAAHLFFPTTPQ